MVTPNRQSKPIGGYFEWEFPRNSTFSLHPKEKLVLLNSGRHALEYILKGLGNVNKVYLPYYTCKAVLDILVRLNLKHEFYSIDKDLQIADYPKLKDDEYIIYTNYFGIKDEYVKDVAVHYKNNVIIDNAQALYCPPVANHQLYSPRKFAGMPDGGIAITKVTDYSSQLLTDLSFARCRHMLKRVELHPSEGYADFKEVSHKISLAPLSRMSVLTETILYSIDWLDIKDIRCLNFAFLHSKLGDKNLLHIPYLDSFSCPMVYPFRTKDTTLKKRLIESQIFIATYWPNVLEWCESSNQEESLITQEIIALPIDQRYNTDDMRKILDLIL